MPTTKLEYRILISSPSDVADERNAAAEIVREVEKAWGVQNNSVLRVLMWENDVPPSFGTEPQDVINRKIGDSWDIYLGLMHARFGTATKKYGSGTEEEFERAYHLWKADSASRVLMIYFKRAPVHWDQIDPDQIKKVEAFRKRVADLGGFYKEFTSTENFKDVLRAHLTSALAELHHGQSTGARVPLQLNPASEYMEATENLQAPDGILDLVEKSVTELEEVTRLLERFGTLVSASTPKVETEASNIKEATSLGDLPGMRKGVSALSKELVALAKGLGENRREYTSTSRRAFETLSLAVSFVKANGTEPVSEVQKFVQTIDGMIKVTNSFIETIRGTDQALNALPGFAREFNVARLVLTKEFSNLRCDLTASIQLLEDLKSIATA